MTQVFVTGISKHPNPHLNSISGYNSKCAFIPTDVPQRSALGLYCFYYRLRSVQRQTLRKSFNGHATSIILNTYTSIMNAFRSSYQDRFHKIAVWYFFFKRLKNTLLHKNNAETI